MRSFKAEIDLFSKVFDEIRDLVWSKTRNQIGRQIRSQVWIQTEQALNGTRYQIKNQIQKQEEKRI